MHFPATELRPFPVHAPPKAASKQRVAKHRPTVSAFAFVDRRTVDQYTVADESEACVRVLCCNPVAIRGPLDAALSKQQLPTSLLGKLGHLERSSAWLHLWGAIGFGIFALVRPFLEDMDVHSDAGRLTGYSSVAVAFMLVISTKYHIYSSVEHHARFFRYMDHHAIVISLTVSTLSDCAISLPNLSGLPWQCIADVVGVGATIVLYFVLTHWCVPHNETRIVWGGCGLGLWRFQHSDKERAGFRVASYVVLCGFFVMFVPAATKRVDEAALPTYFVSASVTLMLLFFGLIWDNVIVYPDRASAKEWQRLKRSNSSMGCIMTAHAWWHVVSLAACVVSTFGKEVAVRNLR